MPPQPLPTVVTTKQIPALRTTALEVPKHTGRFAHWGFVCRWKQPVCVSTVSADHDTRTQDVTPRGCYKKTALWWTGVTTPETGNWRKAQMPHCLSGCRGGGYAQSSPEGLLKEGAPQLDSGRTGIGWWRLNSSLTTPFPTVWCFTAHAVLISEYFIVPVFNANIFCSKNKTVAISD